MRNIELMPPTRLADAIPDEPIATERRTQLVARLAWQHHVSQRTIWRWLARGESDGLPLPPQRRRCQRCGRPLPATATTRRRYCDAICRVYAWRDRDRRS